LKTSVRYHLHNNGVPTDQALYDLCASFQEAVVHVLAKKTLRATARCGVRDVVAASGVAANSRLRHVLRERGQSMRPALNVHIPPIRFCTDNAAMIAGLGAWYLQNGLYSDHLALDASAGLPIPRPSES